MRALRPKTMLRWFKIRHYWAILISQVILLFLSAFLKDSVTAAILFVVCLFGVFGSVIETIWQSALPRALALICGLIAIAGGVLRHVPGISEHTFDIGLFIACVAYSVFIVIAIVSIGRYVFFTDRITSNRIIGSICIYMLIGMFFAFVYAAMGLVMESSFDFPSLYIRRSDILLSDFMYFSYCTLTTIGYGDMIPVNPIAKMTACIEGITGAVYLAIMVARLVGMHVTQSKGSHS